jgi:hypothetical protein
MEEWKNGRMEGWSSRVVEYWSSGWALISMKLNPWGEYSGVRIYRQL